MMVHGAWSRWAATGGDVQADKLLVEDEDERLRAFLEQAFGCSIDLARLIARRAVQRSWPARAVILRQGEGGSETFLLTFGRARAVICSPDGQLALVHEFQPGDIFGAVAPGDPEVCEAEISAVEPAQAIVFRARDFLQLIEAHACIGLAVSRQLVRQLRVARERIVARSILSATGRIHAELLRLARGAEGGAIRPAPVLAALAVQVHSTRETVSRTISALERRGIVRREADALVVVAPKRLAELIV
jgi:CRP-like cAMP-binding protein